MVTEIHFNSSKIHVHHWPKNTPEWTQARRDMVKKEFNENKKNQIVVQDPKVSINGYDFSNIKKVGITIPLFKKQFTMIFEGHCEEFDAHVHITNKEENYLDIFNKLMLWRESFFSNSLP